MEPGTAGIILAGGRSSRMGGAEKSLATLGGRPLIAHAIDRLRPQVSWLALNANGDPRRFGDLGLPVLADGIPDFPGPLAGILAGMRWAAVHGCETVASVAVDTPFFPTDLVARLSAARAHPSNGPALAASGGRLHPVFGLWPVALADDLDAFLRKGETFRVGEFARRCACIAVPFDEGPADPFFNVNRLEDLAVARARMDEDAR